MADLTAQQELLYVKYVKKSKDKVDRVQWHPVQPWLAFVERSNEVTVWNYESNEVIYSNQLGGADEAALQEAALQARAEKEAGTRHVPTPAEQASQAAKGTASGAVRDLAFFDLDTCFWQVARQHSMQYHSYDGSALPSFGKAGRVLGGRRWLVLACENKLVLHDLASARSVDIPRSSVLDSKAPTRLAVLVLNLPGLLGGGGSEGAAGVAPVLAVGTAGGTTYLIDPEKMTSYAKLTGAHKGAVTALLPLGAEKPGGPDMLLTASADGTLAVWDPSRTPLRGPDREMPPRHSFKAHDGAVNDMCYFQCHVDKPEPPPLRLATLGDDKKVALWDLPSFKPFAKAQPLQKASCTSAGYTPWGTEGLGTRPSLLLSTGEVPCIFGLDPAGGDVRIFASLAGKIDPGTKKVPKIYQAAVHPTSPHLVAAATNTGAVLLSFDINERPPVVPLPPQVLTAEALMVTPEKAPPPSPGGKGAQGPTYVMALGGTLWSTALRLETTPREGGGERGVRLEAAPAEAIAQLDGGAGRPVLSASASGRSIAAVWPEQRAYCIYSLGLSGTWEAIDKGSGVAVAWCSTAPAYAVLHAPQAHVAAAPKKKGFFGIGGGGKKEREAAEAAAEEAARAAEAAATVRVHSVDESRAAQHVVRESLPAGAGAPVALHGGALLGVVGNQPLPSGERPLQFVSWRGFAPVGPQLPEPVWISWEPECTLVAMAYPHAIELCRTQPCFERFASLAIPDSTAGLWQSRQLYVATHASLHAIFADPVQAFVQEVQLSSFEGAAAASASFAAPDALPLPAEQIRPAGPVTLAGVRHSYLWLADSLGRAFLVSLRHAGIRMRSLAARGELAAARAIGERGLSAAFHDDVARFLAAMSPTDGVKEALLLSGLSPAGEMALCIRVGDWDRASRCFQALALGVADRSVLSAGTDRAAAADGPPGPPAFGDNYDTVAQLLDQHSRAPGAAFGEALAELEGGLQAEQAQQANGAPDGGAKEDGEAEEAEAPDAVDWDAPLRPAAANGNGDAVEPRPGALSVAPAPTAAEARRIVEATRLGLRFAEAASDSGHADAARAALGVLVRYAGALPVPLLEQLVARLGQLSMTESARNLARAVPASRPGSALRDPAVAAPLAALAGGGHGTAVADTLRGAGLAPLAAVRAAAWDRGQLPEALADWRRLLASATGVPDASHVSVVEPPRG